MFNNANEFSIFIEKYAVENSCTYVESILDYCTEHMLDPQEVAPMINESLKSKLEANFQDLNFIKKPARLL